MASMTGLVDGVATTMTELANGTILIATTEKQADWNERFAAAYKAYQDAGQEYGMMLTWSKSQDDHDTFRQRYMEAHDRLDALDLEADNMMREAEDAAE